VDRDQKLGIRRKLPVYRGVSMGMGLDIDGVLSLSSDEVQSFIREHSEGDYVLLDVRQPGEYAHLELLGKYLNGR